MYSNTDVVHDDVYMQFGFKKWKSHVTSRPLSERSDIVKDLYADIAAAKPVRGEFVVVFF